MSPVLASGDTAAAPRPAIVTIPNVDILEVGTWATSTGVFTFEQADILAAVAAFDDPGYSRPILKIGHTDPRPGFDGEPCIGRLANPRLSEDGMTLYVDIVGVPGWLGDVMAAAFPRRSIEGVFGHETQTGSKHRFALTALSLLGVQAPAVSTLSDLAALWGLDPVAVAASAANSLEESMPEPVRVVASVNLDKVRQTFYSYDNDESKQLRAQIGGWPWVREVYNDFIVVDDDEGNLFQVPWSEASDAPGEVTWGKPVKVRVEYVAAAAGDTVAASVLRAGALRARLAQMTHASSEPPPQPVDPPVEVSPVADPDPAVEPAITDVPAAEPDTTTIQEDNMSLSEIRARLGLAGDADEAAVLAALDSRLQPTDPGDGTEPAGDADGDTATEPVTVSEPAAVREPVAAATKLPPGVVAVDEATLAELRRNAQLGAAAHERQRVSDRDREIEAAVQAGKIAPARKDHWVKAWEADPDGTKGVLASLEPGLVVPTVVAGSVGDPDPEAADALNLAEGEIDGWAKQLGIDVKELTSG